MADSPSEANEPRAKRLRVDKAGRFAALQRLKQLKGSKHKCEVEEKVDDVYEVVDEREYAKKAKERYGDDWIEEDGTGYAEDGRDFFEDEDDYDDGENTKSTADKHNKKISRKRARDAEKPAKGKSSIRNLFSNAVPKKPATVSLADDNILADILGEIDEKPKEMTTKAKSAEAEKTTTSSGLAAKVANRAVTSEYMNNFINNIKIKEKEPEPGEASDDELIERILKPKNPFAKKIAKATEVEAKKPSKDSGKEAVVGTHHGAARETTADFKNLTKAPAAAKPVKQPVADKAEEETAAPVKHCKALPKTAKSPEPSKANTKTSNGFPAGEDDVDFSFLQEEDNQFEGEKIELKVPSPVPQPQKTPAAETVLADLDNLLSNWENICQMDNFEEEINSLNGTEALQNEEKQNFWYWEAWEDDIKRPGEVFLFGKTADGKSICVRVENIQRVLYLLPRKYLLDPITKEATREEATLADVYKEFDEDLAVELNLKNFRSRKVEKNFGYHSIGIDVPQVCDYLEVRYDGKKPAPNLTKECNSIAYMFGATTTPLERFLLERKIKGPCWLTLQQHKVNPAPMSWCKRDVSVADPKFVTVLEDTKPAPPPALTLLTINVRTAFNPKNLKNEICMISMLMHNKFHIDKPAPHPAFNRHMCGYTRPTSKNWPFDLNVKAAQFKATRLSKHDSERSLLSWFLAQYQQIDADLIVTFDVLDCQLDVLANRILLLKIPQWSRLTRVRMANQFGKKLFDLFIGRMVCDVKRSAEECIRSRSFDLQTLCQNVLKIKENERMDVNDEDLLDMYDTADGILKLITLTMQDASYILRMMCELNIMPLALQITNICGNTMTRTLQGGRSERNEFLLLHAFSEKNYIVPDKKKREWQDQNVSLVQPAGRKKAAYSGGLVLEPIRGLYDKYILLMDFNSLYPSIIQEYNICFTTVQQPYNLDELAQLPEPSTEPGILPQQLRRLVESRREVKKLMAAPDLAPELQMQYGIRQMALKLTANSMYGCLGFAHSRFFAQHLAALVTHMGRDILTNTQSLVQKMNYQVVYGDTDSIMVNTNIVDYDQVFKIGNSIKQSVNKIYKQLELDIDGVFSCLLLLKKKKYAAVKVSKNAKGELQKEQEFKGLDIVRRDWSQLAVMVGKVVLEEILSDKDLDEKLLAVHDHLERIRTQINEGSVPLPMFVITKQLSKAPNEFTKNSAQPHVQVALRMNSTKNRRYKKGDMVDYVICEDGTANPATQRGYHLDELKSNEALKLDKNYYLAHQLHPVVTRMVEVLEGTDAVRIAECLGIDPSKYRAQAIRSHQEHLEQTPGEYLIKTAVQKYRLCEKFKFTCIACKTENIVASAFRPGAYRSHQAVLETCANADCSAAPHQYIVTIRNQLVLTMRKCISRFYQNWLVCDNPSCNQNTRHQTHFMQELRPACMDCSDGVLVRQYSERDLFNQLSYFQYMFDLSQHQQKSVTLLSDTEAAYHALRETVDRLLGKSAYGTLQLDKFFTEAEIESKLAETT